MQPLIDHVRNFPQYVAGQAGRYAALAQEQQPAARFITHNTTTAAFGAL